MPSMFSVAAAPSASTHGSSAAASAVSCSGRAVTTTTPTRSLSPRLSARCSSQLLLRRQAPRSLQYHCCRAANIPGGVPDPEALKAAMADPTVQKQVAEMTAAMQNEKVQKRFEELRNDPDLEPMFEEIEKGGMPALMKFMNDAEWLAKVGSKMGDVAEMLAAGGGGGAAAAAAGRAPAAATGAPTQIPTVNNLFDAAKAGDLEAVEDFVAIGRDVNELDEGARTPLHFAVAYGHADIAKELLGAGANVEAKERQGNTPLHYACGYGRAELVNLLVGAGADASAENADGKTPLELVTGEPRNHLNQDTLGALENAELACAERSGSS